LTRFRAPSPTGTLKGVEVGEGNLERRQRKGAGDCRKKIVKEVDWP